MDLEIEWDGDVTRVHPTESQRAKQDMDALFGVNGATRRRSISRSS
jgi:hypothetical protein